MKTMTVKTFVLSLLGILLGWMAAVGVIFARDPDPRVGLDVFRGKGCASCHPILGEGAKIGPDLSRSLAVADGLELAVGMWNHAPQMWQRMRQEDLRIPAFQLEEMEDLFAFLGMARSLDEPGNAEAGQKLFRAKGCVECHAIKGQGGRVGPDLAALPRDRNPVAWAATMWNHSPGMLQALTQKSLPFPQLQGTEMVDLVTFIQVTAGGKERGYQLYLHPPSPVRGATLFQNKQCIRCHSIQGRGGKVGPDLGRVAFPRKYGQIAAAMWNHAPQMNRFMEEMAIPHPNFETQELADLLAYLNSWSFGPPGNSGAGAGLFTAKGCVNCHAVSPGKTSKGPNLTSFREAFSPASVAFILWNHGPIMLENMKQIALPWPLFDSRELADTLAFLESIRKSDAPAPRSATPASSP